MNKIEISETQALQILSYFSNTVPHHSCNDVVTKILIEQSHEIEWDIAELFNFDLNKGYIDPVTLKFVKFDED